jgi:hypothetical protein
MKPRESYRIGAGVVVAESIVSIDRDRVLRAWPRLEAGVRLVREGSSVVS